MKRETVGTVFIGVLIVGLALWSGPVAPTLLFLGLVAWWGREAFSRRRP